MKFITIKDYSIAKFLLAEAKKQTKFIVIHTDTKNLFLGTNLTAKELTERFAEEAKRTKNISIGLS